MKHLLIILVLISAIFSPSRIYAGGNYYWAGDKKVSITTDRTTLVIFFKNEYRYKNQIKRYNEFRDILKTTISDDKRMVVIQFSQEQFKSKLEIFKNLNLTTSDIEWCSFGYKENGVTALRPTNRISFKLKSGFTKNDLRKFMEDKAIFDNTNFGTLMIKANKINLDVVSLANEIYESGVAVYCLPDFIANITKLEDPLYSQQYYLNHTGQFGGFAYDIDIDATEAWDITKGSSNIIVAVIDDGVEAHEDLKDEYNNSKIIGGFTPHTGGNGEPSLSTDGHAEACAGIIAASHNNLDVRGIAPNIKLLTVNIFAPGTSNQEVADGISWASDNGADILSNSWGYTCNAAGINIPQITDAINYARTQGRDQKGCVVVFAAGNNYPQDKCGYGPPGYIEFPATVIGVLCISGSNYNGNIASYSSRGS